MRVLREVGLPVDVLAGGVRVGVSEHGVAELDDPLTVLDRGAHDVAEDPHRRLHRDVRDVVELLVLEGAVEDLGDELADPPLVGRDRPRRERLVDDRAKAGVVRRIGVEHRHARLDLLGREIHQRRCRRARSRTSRSPSMRRNDVVVTRERPEAASVPLVLPERRRLAAEEREPVVRAYRSPSGRGPSGRCRRVGALWS